jgi:DNA-binding NarL/FixJ family response regulator
MPTAPDVAPGSVLEHARRVLAVSRALEIRSNTAIRRARELREHTRQRRSGSTPDAVVALTPRQQEMLELIAAGHGTKDIARMLWLSPATVRNHMASLLTSMGAHSRLEALARGRELGLVGEEPADATAQAPT